MKEELKKYPLRSRGGPSVSNVPSQPQGTTKLVIPLSTINVNNSSPQVVLPPSLSNHSSSAKIKAALNKAVSTALAKRLSTSSTSRKPIFPSPSSLKVASSSTTAQPNKSVVPLSVLPNRLAPNTANVPSSTQSKSASLPGASTIVSPVEGSSAVPSKALVIKSSSPKPVAIKPLRPSYSGSVPLSVLPSSAFQPPTSKVYSNIASQISTVKSFSTITAAQIPKSKLYSTIAALQPLTGKSNKTTDHDYCPTETKQGQKRKSKNVDDESASCSKNEGYTKVKVPKYEMSDIKPKKKTPKVEKSEKPLKKKKEKPPPPEKRLKRLRTSMGAASDRIGRALSQRLFLVKRDEIIRDEIGAIRAGFTVLGSTGNVYRVTIGRLVQCTCPDHQKGNICKHIIFVMVRVLKQSRTSSLIIQAALLSTELESIFANVSTANDASVLATTEVRAVFGEKPAPEEKEKDGKRKEITDDDDCGVCFEALIEANEKDLDWCKDGCGKSIHKQCWSMWRKQGHNTCVYCRAEWKVVSAATATQNIKNGGGQRLSEEGYVNVAHLQGQSLERDCSTYSEWGSWNKSRRWNRRW